MEFTLTTRLEQVGMENILEVEVVASEPIVMGPNVPLGLRDTYDTWEIAGTCDPNGQPVFATSINLGPVNCTAPIPVGAAVNVSINKNGTENSKEDKKEFAGSPICN